MLPKIRIASIVLFVLFVISAVITTCGYLLFQQKQIRIVTPSVTPSASTAQTLNVLPTSNLAALNSLTRITKATFPLTAFQNVFQPSFFPTSLAIAGKSLQLPNDTFFDLDLNSIKNELKSGINIYQLTSPAPRAFGWCSISPNGQTLFTTLTEFDVSTTANGTAFANVVPYRGIGRFTLNLPQVSTSTLYEFKKTADIYGSSDMWLPISANQKISRHTNATRVGSSSVKGLTPSWDGTRLYVSYRQTCFNGPIDSTLQIPVITLQTSDGSRVATFPFQQTMGKIGVFAITDSSYTYQESLSLTNPWKTQLQGATSDIIDTFGDQIAVARHPTSGRYWVATCGYSSLMNSQFVAIFEEGSDASKGHTIKSICLPDSDIVDPTSFGKRFALSAGTLLISSDKKFCCYELDTTTDQFTRRVNNDIIAPSTAPIDFGSSILLHPSGLHAIVSAPDTKSGGTLYLYQRTLAGLPFAVNPIPLTIDANSPLLVNNVLGRYLCSDVSMNLISVSLNGNAATMTQIGCSNSSSIQGGIVLCAFDPTNRSQPLRWITIGSSGSDPVLLPTPFDPLTSLTNPTDKWFQDPWVGANVSIANLGSAGDNKFVVVNSSIMNRSLQAYVLSA